MRRALVPASLVVLVAFLGATTSHEPFAKAASSVTGKSTLHILALGDSDTTGSGDPARVGWVGRYARLLHHKLGVVVAVRNLAVDDKTSRVLLTEVRNDSNTRNAVRKADIVLLGIGGADLNAGDARWEAGKCRGRACYAADLEAFGHNLEKAVAVIVKLRGRKKTLLRAITLPNVVPGARDVVPPFLTVKIGLWQAETLRQKICRTMTGHTGRCIDVLTAFNGASGTENAYAKGLMNKVECCYPSAKGQQLMAKLLLKTGVRRVRLK
jgi:lysophospholipase L1-like esterase